MRKAGFDQAIQELTQGLETTVPDYASRVVIIRDLYGKLRIALPSSAEDAAWLEASLAAVWRSIGVFCEYEGKRVLCNDDFFEPEKVFADSDIIDYFPDGAGRSFRLLDRQVTGQGWSRSSTQGTHPKRIVFYGLKGGVGRSTALAMAAYRLGMTGKKVLVIDFDLESPGLSSILLDQSRLPDLGVVDWFVADAVGQGSEVIPRMSALSGISEIQGFPGRVEVVSAYGGGAREYLPKLSRIAIDLPAANGRIERFGDRARRMLEAIEAHYEPDCVLIDSRAGLHDLAAVSIVELADEALLFATDSPQTWDGYRLLFSFWKERPQVMGQVREKLSMVYALMPERDREGSLNRFIEHSYTLFSENAYQEIPAGAEQDYGIFNFDMDNKTAPHYPAIIKWNQGFLDFNAASIGNSLISDTEIKANYESFFALLDALIGREA